MPKDSRFAAFLALRRHPDNLAAMDEQEGKALHNALAAEVRAAQGAQRLSAPRLEELTGVHRDTIRRIINGDRPVTVVELAKLADALNFTDIEVVERAKAHARAEVARARANRVAQSERLAEKLNLLASSVGKTTDSLYLDVVSHMAEKGFPFPRRAWQEILSASGTNATMEVLHVIADALDIDPRYLTSDDAAVDQEVEARLRFHRAMMDLGVEEVAARALEQVSPDELDQLQRSITKAIEEQRRAPD